MKRLAIFDLDGTLIDSIYDINYYLNLMLHNFGFLQVDYNRVKQIIGHGAKELVKGAINQNIDDKLLTQCLNFYNDKYTNSNYELTKVFDGVYEMLYNLKVRGFYTAILTNKPQQTTDKIFKQFFNKDIIDFCLGQRASIKMKPYPDGVNYILNYFKISNNYATIVGDMETDFFTSRSSNINYIIANWGYGNIKTLKQNGANIFAQSPSEIINLIH